MLDAVAITVHGGNGGKGAVSFHREKFVPMGGPDGGDGGRGGRVFLKAVDDVYTLELYRSKRRFRAGNGGDGASKQKAGAHGEDITLEVPVGTVVVDDENGDLIADLQELDETVLVAHGGRGGWGNKRFATSTNQAPNYAQKGHRGEEVTLRLELRLLAEVGLLGLPNAGKSTFLATVSNAKPKIASYPFTTLEPMLGVVNFGFDRFTLTDLPGLVEGASEGYGLGFEFLKHVRRCRVLLHVVDSSSPDPVTDYELIQGELRAYDPEVASLVQVVAVTKADLDPAAAALAAEVLGEHVGGDVFVTSAETGDGVEALKQRLMELVREEREKAVQARAEEVPVLRPESSERFTIAQDEEGRFVVEGRRVVTFVEMMDLEMDGARAEIERRLDRWGVNKALARAGAKVGDPVVFGETELRYGDV